MISDRHSRRLFLRSGLLGVAALGLGGPTRDALSVAESEVLYNGVRLPPTWPPVIKDVPKDPVEPPYLKSPPAVIPIGVGRQLFVDDFLIETTTLKRSHHRPAYHAKNPVLTGGMVFSDGVWYDPQDRLFKMWYGTKGGTAYATSKDGVAWDKPDLDVKKGTNLVQTSARDSATVWLDLLDKDPQRRYKMFRSASWPQKKSWTLWVHFSKEGIHWSEPKTTGSCGDRSTVFYNPFRKVWVYSLRHGWGQPRSRRYWERADVVSGPMWKAIDEPSFWVGSDRLDPMRDDLKTPTQLYNLDGVAYESLILGLFTIWHGQPAKQPRRDKPNDVMVGFSRDGWSWSRPDRRAFCPVSESPEAWNYGNVQSAGGGCLVVGDRLYFYVSGRRGVPGTPTSGGCSTGLATLRRGGFASMDAGAGGGPLTPRPGPFGGTRPVTHPPTGG